MQPRPIAETCRSFPSVRFFTLTSDSAGGHSFKCRVNSDLPPGRDVFSDLFEFCFNRRDRIFAERKPQWRVVRFGDFYDGQCRFLRIARLLAVVFFQPTEE